MEPFCCLCIEEIKCGKLLFNHSWLTDGKQTSTVQIKIIGGAYFLQTFLLRFYQDLGTAMLEGFQITNFYPSMQRNSIVAFQFHVQELTCAKNYNYKTIDNKTNCHCNFARSSIVELVDQ